MSRYIDADKLRALFDNNSNVDGVFYCAAWEGIDKPSDIQFLIDVQPTADVRENVRGEWIEDKKAERQHQLIFHKVWTCSQCGEQQCRPKGSNFCPNCGAEMMRGEA